MNSKGNDVLLKTTRATECTINNGGYLPVLFGGFLLAGCFLAYIIAVARGNVEAFLPLISDTTGSPPQNGIFGTLVSVGGTIGVVFMILRYMIVLEKNQEKSKLVIVLNKISLFVGILSFFGIMLVVGYPANFYRYKEVWLRDVGLPHMIGGAMFFSLCLVYIAMQSVLTLYLSSKNRKLFFTRLLICLMCTAMFVYHMVTVPDNFGGHSHLYYDNKTANVQDAKGLLPYPNTLGASLKLPIDITESYLSSAITEWLLVIFLCAFFFTFFKETQEYSLMVVIETQMPEAESLNDISSDPSIITSKPALDAGQVTEERRQSEVRTYFRRDSTCQTSLETTEDEEDKVVNGIPTFTTFDNGRYTKRQVSSFEVLPEENKLQTSSETPLENSKLEGDHTEKDEHCNGGTEVLPNSVDISENTELSEGDVEHPVLKENSVSTEQPKDVGTVTAQVNGHKASNDTKLENNSVENDTCIKAA